MSEHEELVDEVQWLLRQMTNRDLATIRDIGKTYPGGRVKRCRELTEQDLHDRGLNPFAVKLVQESLNRDPAKAAVFRDLGPLRFIFQGVRFTLEVE